MNAKFNDEGAIFMGAQRNNDDCKVVIYGVPYDGTTSFRPGARFGPSAIRNISNGIESFCPQLNIDLEDLNYSDFGCLNIPNGAPEPVIKLVKETTDKFISKGNKPLILGGEHSITAGAVSAASKYYPSLIIVQLDAHADLRKTWMGSLNNHACVMSRCLEVLPSKKILQVGIRSGTKLEFIEIRKQKSFIPFKSGQLAEELEKSLNEHLGIPIYLTIDLDWFDPSIMPGTGTPEPGGFLWQDFASIVDVLKNHNIVASDIVELAPELDNSNISSILAAKVARSIIMLLSK